jgi:hypothetical protein
MDRRKAAAVEALRLFASFRSSHADEVYIS